MEQNIQTLYRLIEEKLHERGLVRSRVRDYYDLWRFFSTSPIVHQCAILFSQLFALKCDLKNIECTDINDLFQEKLMINVEKEWDVWLKDIVVSELPKHLIVISDLKRIMNHTFTI